MTPNYLHECFNAIGNPYFDHAVLPEVAAKALKQVTFSHIERVPSGSLRRLTLSANRAVACTLSQFLLNDRLRLIAAALEVKQHNIPAAQRLLGGIHCHHLTRSPFYKSVLRQTLPGVVSPPAHLAA